MISYDFPMQKFPKGSTFHGATVGLPELQNTLGVPGRHSSLGSEWLMGNGMRLLCQNTMLYTVNICMYIYIQTDCFQYIYITVYVIVYVYIYK